MPTPADGKLETGLTREQAHDLLVKYNEDPFHVAHGETLEGLMRYFAEKHDPDNVEFWGQVGLLHDLDWEKWPDAVQHTVKTAELLAEAGANPALAHSIQTHNCDQNPELPKPEHVMEKWLYAIDELSGLIQAVAKMRPSRASPTWSSSRSRRSSRPRALPPAATATSSARAPSCWAWSSTSCLPACSRP